MTKAASNINIIFFKQCYYCAKSGIFYVAWPIPPPPPNTIRVKGMALIIDGNLDLGAQA